MLEKKVLFMFVAAVAYVEVCVGLDHPGGSPTTMDNFNHTLEAILQENTVLKQTLATLSRDMATLKSQVASQRVVAFSVALTKDLQLGSHQALEYDKIYTNIGNSYDTSTGHFTAPVHGLYQFTTTVCAIPSHPIHVQIVKNGIEIGRTLAEADLWEMGSTVTTVEMNAGDLVWVRHKDGYPIETIHGDWYSTFSGVLLRQI